MNYDDFAEHFGDCKRTISDRRCIQSAKTLQLVCRVHKKYTHARFTHSENRTTQAV